MSYINNLQHIKLIYLKKKKTEQSLKKIVNIYIKYNWPLDVQYLRIVRHIFRYTKSIKLKKFRFFFKKIKLFLKKINKRCFFIYLKIQIFSIFYLLKLKYPKLKLSKKIRKFLRKIKEKRRKLKDNFNFLNSKYKIKYIKNKRISKKKTIIKKKYQFLFLYPQNSRKKYNKKIKKIYTRRQIMRRIRMRYRKKSVLKKIKLISKKYIRFNNTKYDEFFFQSDINYFKNLNLSSLSLKHDFLVKMNLNIQFVKFFQFQILYYKFFLIDKFIPITQKKFIKSTGINKFKKSVCLNSRLLKKYKNFNINVKFFKNKYKKMSKIISYIDNKNNKLLYEGHYIKSSDFILNKYHKGLKKEIYKKVYLYGKARFLSYKFKTKLNCIIPGRFTKYKRMLYVLNMSKFFKKVTKILKKKKFLNLICKTRFKSIKQTNNFYLKNPANKLIVSGKKKYGHNVYNNIFSVFNRIFKVHPKEQFLIANKILKRLFIRATVRSTSRFKNRKVTFRQDCYILLGYSELRSRVNLFFLDSFNSICRKKDKTFRLKKMHDLIATEFLNLTFKNKNKMRKTQFYKLYLELYNFMFKEFKFRGLLEFFRNRIFYGVQVRRRKKFYSRKEKIKLKNLKKKNSLKTKKRRFDLMIRNFKLLSYNSFIGQYFLLRKKINELNKSFKSLFKGKKKKKRVYIYSEIVKKKLNKYLYNKLRKFRFFKIIKRQQKPSFSILKKKKDKDIKFKLKKKNKMRKKIRMKRREFWIKLNKKKRYNRKKIKNTTKTFLNILFKNILNKKRKKKIFIKFYKNLPLYYPSRIHNYVYNIKILRNFNNLLLKDILVRKKKIVQKFLKKTFKLKEKKNLKKKKLKLYFIYLKIFMRKFIYKFNKKKKNNQYYIDKYNKYKKILINIKTKQQKFFKLILICLIFKKYKIIKYLKK